jgi:hypothetical protein
MLPFTFRRGRRLVVSASAATERRRPPIERCRTFQAVDQKPKGEVPEIGRSGRSGKKRVEGWVATVVVVGEIEERVAFCVREGREGDALKQISSETRFT